MTARRVCRLDDDQWIVGVPSPDPNRTDLWVALSKPIYPTREEAQAAADEVNREEATS